jgi:hypothetical protein
MSEVVQSSMRSACYQYNKKSARKNPGNFECYRPTLHAFPLNDEVILFLFLQTIKKYLIVARKKIYKNLILVLEDPYILYMKEEVRTD